MSTTDLARPTKIDTGRSQTAIEAHVINETPFGGAIETWAQDSQNAISEVSDFPAVEAESTPVLVKRIGNFYIREFQASRDPVHFLIAVLGEPLAVDATVPTVGHAIFAEPFSETIDDALRFKARYWHEGRAPVDVDDPVKPSRAYSTFRELAEMLSASQKEAAAVVGLSRGAVDTWQRGREPQPKNARRLYRTHTMLKTLTRRLGGHAELQHWLESGSPSARELLLAGDLDTLDRRVSDMVFAGSPAASERIAAYVEEPIEQADNDSTIEKAAATKPRRVKRRPPRRRAT